MESNPPSPHRHAPRYLGEVSDIKFFNMAKRSLGDVGSSPEEAEGIVDSYDQEEAIPARQMRYELSVLPDPVKAEEYLEAYFTTIHIAYPFVPKASFMRTYRSLRSGDNIDSLSPAWLGLLCKHRMEACMCDCSADPKARCSICYRKLLQFFS